MTRRAWLPNSNNFSPPPSCNHLWLMPQAMPSPRSDSDRNETLHCEPVSAFKQAETLGAHMTGRRPDSDDAVRIGERRLRNV
ncbi:unnamed protein product [Lota lota]